ncbi:hypothetical protein HanXRQr2_Chr16g0735281 [Helianthus annuus]|uniref:Uncharacterized protein n=1 Tax=Helianthus annuus TaxID=4232 RepID=A0A9K3DQE7_HELAN|nr:hypothetical protein HanXRQr2_Chr16g0735281 [Helianthus annuus]
MWILLRSCTLSAMSIRKRWIIYSLHIRWLLGCERLLVRGAIFPRSSFLSSKI